MKHVNNNKGQSLVEIIIAIGLMSFIFIGAMEFAKQSSRLTEASRSLGTRDIINQELQTAVRTPGYLNASLNLEDNSALKL